VEALESAIFDKIQVKKGRTSIWFFMSTPVALLVNCFYCTICHNAMPVAWWWGSLKTSRPPCFRPTWKKCVEKLLQYISFKQPSLKAVVPVSVPLAFRKNHEYMQLFWFWNIQIFVDVNSFSYYPREIVFELSCFLFIF